MMYEKPRFTVPASGSTMPENCRHGWLDRRGCCVFCGRPSKAATVESFNAMRPIKRAAIVSETGTQEHA